MSTSRRAHHVVAATALLVASLSLTACEAPHVEKEARALVGRLVAIDGVAAVDVSYEDLGGWESDEVAYDVTVAPGAGAGAVADVAAAVYAAVHDDPDVSDAATSATLHVDDDLLTLRIFESTADPDDVHDVVQAVVPEMATGVSTLEVDTSMREADEPLTLSVNHVVPAGTTYAEVQRVGAEWQQVIDRVGDGGVHVGRPGEHR